MTKVYDTATDLITFARSSSGTALRRVGYGDELVVDGSGNWVGDFDVAADVSEWNADQTSSIAHDNGTLQLTVTAAGPTLADVTQDITTVSRKLYQVTGSLTARSATKNILVQAGGVTRQTINSNTGNIDFVFVASGTTTEIKLGMQAATSGDTFNFDNISVREVFLDRPTDDLVLFNHPDDIPRIEYGSDGSMKGLLIEEERSNLIVDSNDPTTVNWAAKNTNASQNLTGPDGVANSAWTLEDDDASAYLQNRADIAIPATTAVYTASVFVLKDDDETRTPEFQLAASGGTKNQHFVGLNTATGGATVRISSGGSNVNVEDYGDWWRLSLALENNGGNTTLSFRVLPAGGVSASAVGSIGVYGAQMEAGSFPTSYIPTSNGQSTRSPDIASIPVSSFGYNQSAGTVVVEFDMLSDNAGVSHFSQAAFGFHDGTSSNRLELLSASAGTLVLRDRIAPVNYDAISSGNSLEQSTKSAASYASGEASKLVVNGGTALVAGTATTPPAYSTLLLGDTQNVDAELNGHIKSLKYYPRRLTDAQLQELTS